jgi:hypothetical protein
MPSEHSLQGSPCTHYGECFQAISTGLGLIFLPSQLRRQARERRQYVYAKSLEAQERHTYEQKRQLKDALASGKQLPTELRKDAKALGKDLAFDEAQEGGSLASYELISTSESTLDHDRTIYSYRQRVLSRRYT